MTMSDTDSFPDLKSLLEHRPWVRAVAAGQRESLLAFLSHTEEESHDEPAIVAADPRHPVASILDLAMKDPGRGPMSDPARDVLLGAAIGIIRRGETAILRASPSRIGR